MKDKEMDLVLIYNILSALNNKGATNVVKAITIADIKKEMDSRNVSKSASRLRQLLSDLVNETQFVCRGSIQCRSNTFYISEEGKVMLNELSNAMDE